MLLLASLISVHVMLFGVAAMNAACAEDAAQISSDSKDNRFGAGGSDLQRGNVTRSGMSAEAPTNGMSVSDGVGDAGKKAVSDQDASKVGVTTSNSEEHRAGSRGTRGEEEAGSKSALRGDNSAGVKRNETELNPIDTRLTVFGTTRSWRSSRDSNWKKRKVSQPPGNLRYGRISPRTAKSSVVRNAIGQPVNYTSAEPKGRLANDTAKTSELPGHGGIETGGVDPHRRGFIPVQAGGATAPDVSINAAMNHSIISGRDVTRQRLGAAAIGGPEKRSAGIISGTSIQIRHP